MQIAVYSGSFDPLHIGHLSILKCLNAQFDKVILVISPQNPFKGVEKAESAKARFEAAEAAVGRHPELTKVECSNIELGLGLPSYTHRTLLALQQLYPEDKITLVIGADNLTKFREWKNYDRILLDFGVRVYPRKGFDAPALIDDLKSENANYVLRPVDMPLVEISSSRIREGIAQGEDMSAWLM